MEWNKFFQQGQQVGSPRNNWGRMLTFSEPRGKQEYMSKWATMALRYEWSNRCFTWNRSALYWRPNKLSLFTISRLLSTPQILAATINIPLIMLYRRSICLCNSFNNILPAKIEAWFISMALDHNTKTRLNNMECAITWGHVHSLFITIIIHFAQNYAENLI